MLVIGSDLGGRGRGTPPRRAAETLGLPSSTRMGRGILPAGHPSSSPARSVSFGRADLVIVVGAPLDFRLGYGVFVDATTHARRRRPLADSPARWLATSSCRFGVGGSRGGV